MENLLSAYTESDKKKLIEQSRRRLDASLKYYRQKRDKWRKFYKIYRCIKDESGDDDEPNIMIGVAFGLIEDIVARLAGPMLGKLNIRVKPKKLPHAKAAENFYNMCRSFFGSARYRVDWIDACRERAIAGSAWEFDDWANDYAEGYRWGLSLVIKKASELMPTLAALADKMGLTAKVQEFGKIVKLFPLRIGYQTRFPSIFLVHAQPGVKKAEDLKWIIEIVPFVSLDDLRKAKYTIAGQVQPVFDLSEIDALKAKAPEALIKPEFPVDDDNKAFETEYLGVDNTDIEYDVDGVQLSIERRYDEILVIANGRWVIQHIKKPFFKPGIKARLRVYTQDRNGLFGIGVIEPLEDLFEELDDVHNMAMENWIRIIHKLILYDQEMVPFPDDFNPRSGGRVRVKNTGRPLRDAFMPVDHADVTGTMITTEQNLRGYIGSIAAVADMTPGPMGTKPYHNTYGGLMEVQAQFAKRFTITSALDQAETAKQMEEMYWLYDQFMFEPMSFSSSGKDNTGAVMYSREDIETEGEGFEYFASDDPSYGDPVVLRNQWMVLFDRLLAYEQSRLGLPNGTEMQQAHLDKAMAKVLEAFGIQDTSEYLSDPSGVMDPDTEFELMLKGVPVEVNPKEALTQHYVKHFLQKMEIERGERQVPPQVLADLIVHLDSTAEAISQIVMQPEAFVMAAAKDKAMAGIAANRFPAAAMGPQMGLNLPGQQGMPPGAAGAGPRAGARSMA